MTCGDWDVRTMLPSQLKTSGIPVPSYCHSWINLKKSQHRMTRKFPRHLTEMLRNVGLEFEGRPHSGIDDTTNIYRVMKQMAERGFVFELTTKRLISE